MAGIFQGLIEYWDFLHFLERQKTDGAWSVHEIEALTPTTGHGLLVLYKTRTGPNCAPFDC